MNIIIKIIGIAVCAAFLSNLLKKSHREYSIAIGVSTSIVILFFISGMIGEAIESMKNIANRSNINTQYFSIIIKVVLIAYLSEYTVAVLTDAGESAIAKKVEMSGKIIIFIMTIPILEELFKIILSTF